MARLFPSASRTWRIRAKCRVCCSPSNTFAYGEAIPIGKPHVANTGEVPGLLRLQHAFRDTAHWTSQSWDFLCRAWRVLVRRCGCSSKSHIRYPFTSSSKYDHGFDQWSKNGCCTSSITLQNVALWISQSWGGGCRAWRVWVRLCTSHSGHSGRLPSIRAVLTRPHVACGWWDAGPEIYAVRGNL